MIRINLIPPELIVKKEEARLRSKMYLSFFLLVLVLSLVGVFQFQRVARLKKEIAKINREIEEIAPEVNKARQIQKDIKEAKKESAILFGLVQEQPIVSRTMDELTNILPEHVWLTRLFLDKENLRISGTADKIHTDEVYDFRQPLEDSPCFKEVQLPNVTDGKVGIIEVINFTINCKNEPSF